MSERDTQESRRTIRTVPEHRLHRRTLLAGALGLTTVAGLTLALRTRDQRNALAEENANLKNTLTADITPSATATRNPDQLLVQLETPIGVITATVPATSTPTETLAVNQERKDVMGDDEITNWDAEISIKANMTASDYRAWYDRLNDLYARRVFNEGDIRTYDKIKELKLTGISFEFSKADGTFPKAKEVVSEAKNIGILALTNLGYQDIADTQATAFGLKIIDMTVNRSADGQTFSTRNTFPDTKKNTPREKEAELEICSIYEPGIQISHEVRKNGILHESYEAAWNFVFNVHPDGIKSKYTELKTLRVKNASGKFVTLSWRLFDFGSQPNTEAEMKAPKNLNQYVWGSEIKKPCGKAKPQPTKALVIRQAGPGGQPTPVPTTPPEQWPTPVPTNEHRNDTPSPAPTRVTSTPIPVDN